MHSLLKFYILIKQFFNKIIIFFINKFYVLFIECDISINMSVCDNNNFLLNIFNSIN